MATTKTLADKIIENSIVYVFKDLLADFNQDFPTEMMVLQALTCLESPLISFEVYKKISQTSEALKKYMTSNNFLILTQSVKGKFTKTML
jgi:hypothetical protein